MRILQNLSNLVIPSLIFYIIAYGMAARRNVYEDFVKGAKNGFMTVISIMPTLIGLMMGVGIIRASGFLDLLTETIKPVSDLFAFPAQLVPLVIIRMFSSSAATGMVLDLFKEYGPDSNVGFMTSVMMSCTETIFYTMSVYFIAAKVTKTRYTLAGALVSTFSGIAASTVLAGLS